MAAPEHSLQVFTVNYLRYNGVFCFAIPNGGRRDIKTGAMLKKEGVLAGVADLAILLPQGEIIFVELKNGKKGVQSESQKMFQEKVQKLGFTYLIWRKTQDCIDFVHGLKKVLRNEMD